MVMADFSGDEAEELRRAMSFHRSPERMARVEAKLRERMAEQGAKPNVADAIIQSAKGFALYGFPEGHAISLAILAYGSAWLKVHRGPEFFASLLNNQPMGFYSSATLVKDARRHGTRRGLRASCARSGPAPSKAEGIWRAADLLDAENGQAVCIAGNVICRQRPGTAKGFVLISLEDETGIANAIVPPTLFEASRLTI